MRRSQFITILICITIPPFAYLFSLHLLEQYFQGRESQRINQILIQDIEALYEGRKSIEEEIEQNIGHYLNQNLLYSVGIRPDIVVKTKSGRLLYPSPSYPAFRQSPDALPLNVPAQPTENYLDVATDNYRILNEGLELTFDLEISHLSWLSNSILVVYVLIFGLIALRSLKRQIRDRIEHEEKQEKTLKELSNALKQAESRFKEVAAKEADYTQRIAQLRKEKGDLTKDVDVLFEDLEKMEAGLKTQQDLREHLELEALQLQEELNQLKERNKKPRKKKKKAEWISRRLTVLYKNCSFTERAVEGYLALSPDFQLKSEEMIHKLNEDHSQVSVKRKVFGKGGKKDILEAVFSYSGRIYFKRDAFNKTTILAVGTKNTQDKDLAYIEKFG